MKKRKLGIIIGLCGMLLVAGCQKKEENTAQSSSASTTEETTEQSSTTEETKEKAADSELSKLFEEAKKNMDAASISELYSSKEPLTINQGKVKVIVDTYGLAEVKDFNQDFSIPFGNQTDRGGILLLKVSVENEEDKDIYFSPTFSVSFTNAKKDYTNTKSIFPDMKDNLSSMFVKEKKVSPKEKRTGYLPIAIDAEALDQILQLGEVSLSVPPAYTSEDTVKREDMIGEEQKIALPLSAEGDKTVAENAKFYEDKATINNMGTKTMIESKDNVDQSQNQDQVDVTLKGYQVTEFVPNDETAPRFSNFNNGIVLMTIKYLVKNDSQSKIRFSSSSSTLIVNDGQQKVLSEGMLINNDSSLLEPSNEKEFLQVFAMDKEQYDKIWKDKSFRTELTLRGEDGKGIGKGKPFTFDLK